MPRTIVYPGYDEYPKFFFTQKGAESKANRLNAIPLEEAGEYRVGYYAASSGRRFRKYKVDRYLVR